MENLSREKVRQRIHFASTARIFVRLNQTPLRTCLGCDSPPDESRRSSCSRETWSADARRLACDDLRSDGRISRNANTACDHPLSLPSCTYCLPPLFVALFCHCCPPLMSPFCVLSRACGPFSFSDRSPSLRPLSSNRLNDPKTIH